MSAPTSDLILERMMALHPKIIDLTLDRVWRLLDALGNPQNDLPPVIHIAGTNGKGSTLAMIRAGLEAAGKTCHAYTSPHLARFHERIRLAGELISEDHLTAILDECYAANGNEAITYFEITTCAALLAMARTSADYTLLEVGLGGRLDATNVIDRPALTVITPVSIDHEQFLGNTLAKIAGEKAGILKRRVPCVVGPQQDDALAVIEARATALGAPLLAHGQHWHAFEERGRLIYQDETGLCDLPLPNLPGAHQIENAGAALAALRHLHAGDAAYEAAVSRAIGLRGCSGWCPAPWSRPRRRRRSGSMAGTMPPPGRRSGGIFRGCPTAPLISSAACSTPRISAAISGPWRHRPDRLIALSIPGEANTLPAEATAEAAQAVGLRAETAETALQAVQRIAARPRRRAS